MVEEDAAQDKRNEGQTGGVLTVAFEAALSSLQNENDDTQGHVSA